MPAMLGAVDRIKRRGNIPYIGVHLIAASSSKYYVYAVTS